MKALSLFFLVLAAPAMAAGPTCARLREVAFHYDQRMKNKQIDSCNNETLSEITNVPNKDEILGRMKCAQLGVLEERARTLENQLGLLEGFEKLKTDIRNNREGTADPNLTRAQTAARNFRRALNSAKTFEMLLRTGGDEQILRQLKSFPEGERNSPEKLRDAVRAFCTNRGGREASTLDACHSSFTIDQDSYTDINAILSQSEVTEENITQWNQAMAIQRGPEEPWSFTEMHRELATALPKISDARLTLTREELRIVNRVPDFQNASSLPFLQAMKNNRSGLSGHASIENFRFLGGDLKERLRVESRSKIGWLWSEIKTHGIALTEEQRAMCNGATADFEQARNCWAAIKSKKNTFPDVASDKAVMVDRFERNFDLTLNYHDKFGDISRCLEPVEGPSALVLADRRDELTNCSVLNMMNGEKADLQNELLVINGLRNRIAAQSERDMKFRNFAIEKLSDMNCAAAGSSVIECEENVANLISREAVELTSSVLGLSIVHHKKAEVENLEALCSQDPVPTGMEVDLCSFYDPAPATANVTDRPAPETGYSPYVEPENARNPSREAFVNGLAGIGWGIVNQLNQRPQSMYPNPYGNINPYPYNYNPYVGAGMSPSDQILFNARFYGGYGFYTPTLGTAPYTAFPTYSTYVQAGAGTSNTSPYFSNFTTYR